MVHMGEIICPEADVGSKPEDDAGPLPLFAAQAHEERERLKTWFQSVCICLADVRLAGWRVANLPVPD